MFDCGEDWRTRLAVIAPDALFLTHAHPDHAGGVGPDAPCPVYATAETWAGLENLRVADKRIIAPGRSVKLAGLSIRAFPLIHSLLAPTVGFRIAEGNAAVFYAPDIVAIVDRARALRGVGLYIGDGATPERPMVRRRDGALFGHTTIRAQIGWCAAEHVPRAIFTHCGSQVVTADGRSIGAKISRMGKDKGVSAELARDGLVLRFP
jgi:phosphoribosyl 1,2-cyclic phosphodiesterase